MNTEPTYYATLRDFAWDSVNRTLHGYSEIFAGELPSAFTLRSHHTGRECIFHAVGPTHTLYDEDGWDGEARVYTSGQALEREIVCHITHAY